MFRQKRIKSLFLLFFVLPGFISNAQNAKDDSLKTLLRQNIADTLRVKYLLYFADRVDGDNREQARVLLDSAERVATRINNKLWLLSVFTSRGLLFHNIGKSDSAIYFYNKVLAYENDSSLLIPVTRVWGNLSNYYRQAGDLNNALIYALKSENYCLANNKYRALAQVYANIAGILYDLNDNKKALEYDRKAVLLVESHNINDILALSYRNLAASLGESGHTDSAMFYYQKSLGAAIANGRTSEIGFSSQAIGVEYFLAGNIDSAYVYLNKARKIYEEEKILDESYPYLYCYLGKIELVRKNFTIAEAYLLKADSASLSLGYASDNLEIKKALKDLYAAKGNWQKAFQYQEQFVVINDSLQRDENNKTTRELEKKYDTAKKEKENAELKAANEIQQQKISSRNKILLATIASCILLVLLLFFIFRNYRNEKKHVVILDKLNAQLTNQRDEILKINQLLQLKVLRTQMNPHFIYNCLNSINNLVMKGENDKASNYLLNFSKLLRMILDFSDKTFIDLEDEIKFIQLYLSLEAMRMGNDFSYEVKVTPALLDDDISVPSLLVQPFIENAIWHGLINKTGEKKLSVNFDSINDEQRIVCNVEDNGIGREKAAELKQKNHSMLHESKGVRITQERIELLQYQIKNKVSVIVKDKINSNNELIGTKVELVLPVNG